MKRINPDWLYLSLSFWGREKEINPVTGIVDFDEISLGEFQCYTEKIDKLNYSVNMDTQKNYVRIFLNQSIPNLKVGDYAKKNIGRSDVFFDFYLDAYLGTTARIQEFFITDLSRWTTPNNQQFHHVEIVAEELNES